MSDIKKAREKLGISQRELGKRLGIPKRTIENWEVGKRKPPAWAERLIIEKVEKMKEGKKMETTILRHDARGFFLVGKENDEFIMTVDAGAKDEEVDWELIEKQANENGYTLEEQEGAN